VVQPFVSHVPSVQIMDLAAHAPLKSAIRLERAKAIQQELGVYKQRLLRAQREGKQIEPFDPLPVKYQQGKLPAHTRGCGSWSPRAQGCASASGPTPPCALI
jgi:hypothetical protein